MGLEDCYHILEVDRNASAEDIFAKSAESDILREML